MKTISKQKNTLSSVLFGVIASLCLIIVNGGVIALLIMNETIAEANIGFGAMIALLLAVIVGCACTIMFAKQKLLSCVLHTGIILTALILYAVLVADGPKNGIVPTVCLLFGSMTATYLAMGKAAKKHRFSRRR